ncbi:DNA polymerase subunit alpha B [Pseudozyma hubeiensis]|nr:DNA polymerase subunit alpha B [Pseudozyma hubeiensis]
MARPDRSDSMLVTGRVSRFQPWWLIVGVCHLLLLFAIASAAPVGDRGEIELASDDQLSHHEPSFRLYDNALRDSSSGRSSFQQTPSDFASSAPASREPQMLKTALRDTPPTRWERILERFRRSSMLNYGRWRTSLQAAEVRAWQKQDRARQKAEARRLAKLARKPGEVEFQPVFKLSKEELKATKHAKASHDARVSQEENGRLKPAQRETQDPQVAQTAPRSSSQQEVFQPTGHYQQLYPAEFAAQDPTGRSQQAKGRRKLSRIPSSEMDAAMLERKARMAAEYGAPDLSDVLHRVPLPTLHKRAPPSSPKQYTEHPSVRYEGQGWRMFRGTDGREIRFAPYEPHRDVAVMSKSFGELTPQERKSVSKTIPVVKDLQKNSWNIDGLNHRPEIGAHINDRNRGMYYFDNRMPQTIGVRSVNGQHQRYQFEYLPNSRWGGARRQWATFEELPDHLKQFLRWQSQSGLDYPWLSAVRFRKRSFLPSSDIDVVKPAQLRKRTQEHQSGASLGKRTLNGSPSLAGTSARSDRFQTFTYPGEVIERRGKFRKKIVLTRLEGNHYTPYRFHFLDETGTKATSSSKWSSLSPTVQEGLERQSREVGYVASTALRVQDGRQHGVKIGEHPFDLNAAYFHPEYPSENVKILRNPRGEVVFQRGAANPIRYSELPSHLKSYLEGQRSVRDFMLEAEQAARRLRKRSLETRAPPTHVAFVRYPGKKIVITVLEGDRESLFRFHLLHEDGKTVYKTSSWSSLSSDIRDGLKAQEPKIGSVVESHLSKEGARQQGVKIGEDAFDLANAYAHPEFLARDIRISHTKDGKIVFDVDRSRPVEFSELPPHLRVFVMGDGNLDMVVRAAAEEAGHRLHKRVTSAEAQLLGRRAGSDDDADEVRKVVESVPASKGVGAGSSASALSDGMVTDTPGNAPTSARGSGRSELFRQFGPTGRPYKLLDDSQLYFEDHHYGGEGFRVLRNNKGYRFARFRGNGDEPATFEPFYALSESDKNELRTLLPGVDQMVVRGPTFEQLQLLRKSGDFGSVYLDGKEPEQIWVTQQERGTTYHRFDRKRAPLNNGDVNAWSFKELPDHLQQYLDDIKHRA